MVNLLPFRPRQIACLFTRKSKTRFFTNSQHLANGVNRLNAGRVAGLIKEGIARDLYRIGHPEGAVRVMFFRHPAWEKEIAVIHTTTAVATLADEPPTQAPKGRKQLQAGARS